MKNPTKRPVISLCMIARDEERFLRDCLASVRGVVDEIVLVDTGSKDRTVEIAREFGARIVDQPWTEHFAEARNRALGAARGGWILALDADERLEPKTAPRIRQAVEAGNWENGFLHFRNMTESGPCGREWLAVRAFRQTPGMHYIGRIHEQLVHLVSSRTAVIDAIVYHCGYQASVYIEKQKKARNTRLLERALSDPEAQDPLLRSNYLYHWANLAVDRELVARYDQFASYIRSTWAQNPPRTPWITAGLAEYARLLTDVGRYAEARQWAEELLGRNGESPMLRYLAARALAAEGDLAGAERELDRVLEPGAPIAQEHCEYTQDLALVRSRAQFLKGLILEKRGGAGPAVSYYYAAAREEPEQDLMRRTLACALVQLDRYAEALETLETSASLVANPEPGADCLGLVLALLTRSVPRLGFWGEKVRRLAGTFPPAARLLERVAQLGAEREFRLDDFPEIVTALGLKDEPGAVRMPQTSRHSTDLPR